MSESLKCLIHKSSYFIEGNVCNANIQEDLIKTYDTLYNLKIKYTPSLNTKPENLSAKELPYILYGNVRIERGNINSFLKRLTNIDFNLEINDEYYLDGIQYSKYEIFIMEKIIFSDLQAYVDFYSYMKYSEKTPMFIRVIKFLFQPIQTIKSFIYDPKYLAKNNMIYGITTLKNVNNFYIFINQQIFFY